MVLLIILQVGVQGSSPEPLSVDREICLQSCLISKHFVSRTSFSDVLFFPFQWLWMLSSHLSLGLPLCLFPFIFNFTTTLNIDSPSFFMVKSLWYILVDYFLTMGSILLYLYRSSILFLSHLMITCTCIILLTFMPDVVLCCSSLFVKVQHSIPKIRMGLKMVW